MVEETYKQTQTIVLKILRMVIVSIKIMTQEHNHKMST